jgi:hypothetical protein
MGKISDKYAQGLESFAAFEEKFGSDAAESILDRLVDEAWSRGSGEGIYFRDIVWVDATNSTYHGCIEHEDVWYNFVIHVGDRDGTAVEEFELDDPDITVRPPELEVAELLAQCMRDYKQRHPYVQEASNFCMKTLQKRHAEGVLSAATQQTHALLRGILGDLSFRHQDYDLDGLAVAAGLLKSADTAEQLYQALTQELKAAINKVCVAKPELGSPTAFLGQALQEVYRLALV